ncbi:ATP synthase B/B' CF(0) [uncultured Desulfobacterium sp.]|uniref:ATP synthase B/B' CF(0) n=1 Tax=uncultured Desulfobacterium sp. TaxID=201089 RepID=A0A445MZG2_9BACT|nr:ATP synthase B/B' CF(0) [uncultured Desulfobacterium sp.]
MLFPDVTLFIQIANFLILMFVLNIILYRPIRGILAKRRDEEAALKTSIDDYQGRADKDEKGIEEGKIKTRKEGAIEKDKIKGQSLEKERGILQEASSLAEQKLGNARKELDAKVADVRKSLEAEVAVFSTELAEKILGREIR